jgi:hypothetical protein
MPASAACARPAWSSRGGHARGGVGGQGSLVTPVQRGRRCEHEDGEGKSSGKKNGGVAHQGGHAPMR